MLRAVAGTRYALTRWRHTMQWCTRVRRLPRSLRAPRPSRRTSWPGPRRIVCLSHPSGFRSGGSALGQVWDPHGQVHTHDGCADRSGVRALHSPRRGGGQGPPAASRALSGAVAGCASGCGRTWLLLVQASGLAAGKGVLMPTTVSEAEEAIQQVGGASAPSPLGGSKRPPSAAAERRRCAGDGCEGVWRGRRRSCVRGVP
jgi:hypothetical protein